MKPLAKAQYIDESSTISYAGYRSPPELIS